jgi:dihydroorotase
MLDANGKVRSYLFDAKKRGVIFDVGHGGGSFDFRQAFPAVHQGFLPDSISTDLHVGSMNAGMKDMTNVMSKFLNLDMSLQDIIERSTANPAREIHHEELGQLSVGSTADIALLSLEKGDFGFVDSLGGKLQGHQKLVCQMTIRNGLIVWDLNGLARDDWRKNSGFHPDPRWEGQLPVKR